MRNSILRICSVLRGLLRTPARPRAGVTLTELMVAVTILTIGVIGSMGAFKYINAAMGQSRLKTIATNLAQEKMEVLKNKSYFQLLVTTASASSTGYSPNFNYDTDNYPPQTITLWGLPALTRVVNVDYVSVSGSVATILPYTANDPGMKKITVTVMWTDKGSNKKVQIASYYENPTTAVLSAGFKGTVTDASAGTPVGNALVQVMGSPKWHAYSDPATGAYSFQVAPGTYTLVCSTQGYFPVNSGSVSVAAGPYPTQNFTLNKIGAGSISGMAYVRDHLVISQVVASTVMVSGVDIEYVELYNPTTAAINISDGAGGNNIKLRYYGESGAGHDVNEFALSYISTYVASGRYYLIANSFPLTVGGSSPITDALFAASNRPPCGLSGVTLDCLQAGQAGAVQILDSNGNVLDTVGWAHGAAAKAAPAYEGTPIGGFGWWIGLPVNYQILRDTALGWLSSNTGRAYDNNNNNSDMMMLSPIIYGPYGTNSGVKTASLTGTPAAGAVVTADDGLSTSATASSTGYFLLTNVATGAVLNTNSTWEVIAASNTVLTSSAGITVSPNQNKDVGMIVLSTAVGGGIADGHVYGSGPDQNKPLPGILVGCGSVTANTDSQGYYRLFLGTGTTTITANPGMANGNYQSADADVTLDFGLVTDVPDFHLAQGGTITGYVTSGTGALPNIVVQATNGGPVYEDASDSTGHYYISATTSSVAYTVTPVLDPLQSFTSLPANPLTASLTVPSSSVFAGTITVVGAMGTITGTVVISSVSITTGVLVVASTGTISDPLPTVTAASSPSDTVYYSVSSQADGTYSLDVRSSTTTTYNMRAFYPVVDANTGTVTYTSRVNNGVSVGAGATVTRNFAW